MSIAAPADRIPLVLTAEGRAWLQARHDRVEARLAVVADELAAERTEALLDEHRQLSAQLEELRPVLRDAVAPSEVRDDPSVVELGDLVEVEFVDGDREVFLIVHPLEAGLDERRTAADSPLASAVLGRRPGDRVTVASPAGDYDCLILRRGRID
jgi:transcription elongation factor GreA